MVQESFNPEKWREQGLVGYNKETIGDWWEALLGMHLQNVNLPGNVDLRTLQQLLEPCADAGETLWNLPDFANVWSATDFAEKVRELSAAMLIGDAMHKVFEDNGLPKALIPNVAAFLV